MKYQDIINFEPLEELIQLTDANEKEKAANLIKTYVMSDSMAEILNEVVIPQLQFERFYDNKGIFVVGNYGTGKSHLMSVISSIAEHEDLLDYVKNESFKEHAKQIAGKFEVLRIELGAVTTPLRDIILKREIEKDLQRRGIDFTFPEINQITNNKQALIEMMGKFEEKYPDKGYLIVIDELLDFLKAKKEHELILDLGFLRELGEICKSTRIRVMAGIQESLFDSPRFTHVKDKIFQIKDRFENVVIKREDIAYVVANRLLKKDEKQKALVGNHLQKFTHLYKNMLNKLEDFVELYPIHPMYIEIFQNIYIAEHRQILKTISLTMKNVLNEDIPENDTGIISYDSYWDYIKEMTAAKTDPQIREVVEKSRTLENIVESSYTRPAYKKYAIKIIKALSVHRLTTGDIYLPVGITLENIKDDLCFNIPEAPENSEEFLLGMISTIMREIIKTVSGQFISHNSENGQYYLDLKKDIDYQAKVEEKADALDEDSLNPYYYKILLRLLDWDEESAVPYVPGHQIWEYRLLWKEKNIERLGYLFFGNPNERPTAHPPRDFYIYFSRIYEHEAWKDEKREDEVFFKFNIKDDDFVKNLRLYAAASFLAEHTTGSGTDKKVYSDKAKDYEKSLIKYIRENILECFTVTYKGESKTIFEAVKIKSIAEKSFKEVVDTIASMYLSPYFNKIYPDYPRFSTVITLGRNGNLEQVTRAALNYIAEGKGEQLGAKVLDSLELLDGSKIDPYKSRYAKYYLDLISNRGPGMVINKKDLFEMNKSEEEVDKNFKWEPNFTVIILASLIYSGDIIFVDNLGKEYDSTKLNELASANMYNLLEFKYVKRPKDIPINELVKLFDYLGIPAGHIKNPAARAEGVSAMISKVDELIKDTIAAKESINKGFMIWDMSSGFIEKKKDSLLNKLTDFKDFLDGLKIYNTPQKLKSFKYTAEELDKNFKPLDILEKVKLLKEFKTRIESEVNYLQTAEHLLDDEDFKKMIGTLKGKIKDALDNVDLINEAYVQEVCNDLELAKQMYIKKYMEEHKKYRLDVNAEQKKEKILLSNEYTNLERLCQIKDIFNVKKFDDIKNKLQSAKTCYTLTKEKLKRHPICDCEFKPNDSNKFLVYGLMDAIEDEITSTLEEWKNQLIKALEDSIVLENIKYLKPEERKEIEEFLSKKEFPLNISAAFINAVNSLMEGFEKVELNFDAMKKEISSKGPMTVEELKTAFEEYLKSLIKGREKEKVRILIK
ncbi:DUF6079 family protein [Caldanaerobacter subterraneus KAk]|uniref:Exonuclease SbcC n=1 Tax=Caldanaerobacter subterraneus subsp. pacificus DSM 12653 TaxID=391606 RepID=A0A0F5PN49_9THEO|nr:DUF6079 family protein [Caldanaerobacter subterraneus]KKC29836.1 hypothetical protein CDSM653_01065 [Caldanaerobacter subterraneus subsp. pacificus DSM 12653]